ncbi:hypothetical protein MBM_08879 [Drepanopeziza brunnea f. sp. 'multigermtubi' MB_m1]|uniref:Uncharacterized protein n=1 Tax=Marssonina brunnea f. sp. multigermtubi (strain MB_m1) TaxID=1072389 RepID=K1W790_MARBU|nr:uncharacterized protein MBM_08879 [Drepanopeziza brunnea f. sp. 'multigermtubi' MB_m1]EKD12925.1 hypothetical protein MBM_08879 [Drepanopeziza brunnea f. sp. 'multigermtubi' MB_m1]
MSVPLILGGAAYGTPDPKQYCGLIDCEGKIEPQDNLFLPAQEICAGLLNAHDQIATSSGIIPPHVQQRFTMQAVIAERDMLDLIPLRPFSKTEARRISGGLGIETPLQHVPFVGYLGCAECLAALHQGIIIL